METTVTYMDGVRFAATARGHRIVSDQPLENGGEGQGMTPPELLLASLGSCAAFYAVQYLNARGLSAEGLSVRVTAGKAATPARLDHFNIQLYAPGLTEPRLRDGMLRAVNSCLVHNTLLHPPAIHVELAAVDAVGAPPHAVAV